MEKLSIVARELSPPIEYFQQEGEPNLTSVRVTLSVSEFEWVGMDAVRWIVIGIRVIVAHGAHLESKLTLFFQFHCWRVSLLKPY